MTIQHLFRVPSDFLTDWEPLKFNERISEVEINHRSIRRLLNLMPLVADEVLTDR